MRFFKRTFTFSLLITFIVFLYHPSISFSMESYNRLLADSSDLLGNPSYKDYNPIETKKGSLKYYPDEVERRVHELLIDSYLGHTNRLRAHYEFFKQEDDELRKNDKPVTGLHGHVLDIVNSHIKGRDEYIESQKEALQGLSDKDVKKLIEIRLKDENLIKANKLLKDEKKNKAGRAINSLLRSVDIVSLSLGSLLGSTIETAVNTIMNIKDLGDVSIREKKAIVQLEEFLKKNPDSIHAEEVREKLEELRAKKLRTDSKKEIALAKSSIENGEPDKAIQHYKNALKYDPESKEALEGLQSAESLIQKRDEAIKRTLRVSRKAPSFSSIQEKEDYENLLYVTIGGSSEEIVSKSREFVKKHKNSPLRDEALYNLSIASDIKGEHDEAKRLMKELIDKEPESNMAYHAEILLDSESYNQYKAFNQARNEHKIDTLKYALGGKELAKNNISIGTTQLILQGVKSVETLGMANLLGAGVRTMSILGDDPISNQEIIDRGEGYLIRYPDSEKSKEVRLELAKAYEREHDYAKALNHYTLSGEVSDKKIKSLREKMANNLFHKADITDGWEYKAYYYRTILTHYQDTETAKKAEEKLSELLKIKDQRFRLSKSFILENRALFGPHSINLKPELLDGNIKNKEIADKGIAFLKENRIKVYYQTEEGIEEKIYPLSSQIMQGFEAKLRELNYKRTLHRDEKKRDTEGQEIFTAEKSLDETLNAVYLSKDEQKKRESNIKVGAKADISPSGESFNSQGMLFFSKYSSGLAFGIDERSPNLGLKFPLVSSPLEIESRIGEGRLSVYPKIRIDSGDAEDSYLYK